MFVSRFHRPYLMTNRTVADADGSSGGDAESGDAGVREGDTDESDEGDEGDPDESEEDDEGAGELADAGKKALDRMKGKWHAERTRARELQRKLDAANNKDPEADERLAKANRRILRAEIRAAAKGKLSDPTDAFSFLDLDDFEVDDDGDVDEDEIADAIEKLVKNKPYLAAQGGRFAGGGDGGARKEPKKPRQLTREDLRKMTPQQIHEAKAAGQLADLLKNPR